MCIRYLGFLLLVWFPGSSSSDPHFTEVSRCGKPPVVPEAEVQTVLQYQCSSFYTLMGPETVRCYSDGTWSEVPTCEATFCAVNTAEYPDLKPAGVKYVGYGEKVELACVDKYLLDNFSVVECNNGTLTVSRCCNRVQITTRTC